MARTIGIRHRRKKTREGEARPTMVAIKEGEKIVAYGLENDTAELDFLMARFPIAWRNVGSDEDIEWFDEENAPNGIHPHHCKWRRFKKDEDVTNLNETHLRRIIDPKGLPVDQVLTKLPTEFEGLRSGDSVAMVLGGSGDRFAAALSRRGEEISSAVYRIPPFSLADNRGEADKEDDHITLIQLWENIPELFYQVRRRDRGLIRVKEVLAVRQDAQKNRISCELRLLQSLVGRIFLNEEGHFPDGVIEAQYDEIKANDRIFQALLAEEACRDKELKNVMHQLDIWNELFEPIEGCGERIAAAIIAPIGDIRRFKVLPDFNGAGTPEERQKRYARASNKTRAKLKKFCGVHVMHGGDYGDTPTERQFARRREGQVANWSPSARQALYLLADQFKRRPNSEWGKRLLHYKLTLREKHPDVVEVDVKVKKGRKTVTEKKKRYTNGHIHKMAQWRTLTKFVEWLCREWMRIEERNQQAGD